MPIPSLPNEVLAIIFSFVSSPQTCLHVALACKTFKILVRPFQYRSIELSFVANPDPRLDKPVDSPYRVWRAGKRRKFDTLLTTLNTDDKLRPTVNALSVTILKSTATDSCEESATLAHILPCLGSLRLSPPPIELSLSSHTLLHSLYIDFKDSNLRYLRRGRWLKMSHPRYLSRYLWLPSLRNLYTKRLDLEDFPPSYFYPQHHRRTSPVTTLRLRDVENRTIGILAKILEGIRALKIFTLEMHAPCYGSRESMLPASVQLIGLSLANHADTLVELIIASSNNAWFSRPFLIGSMTHYTALKRLGIPETFLVAPRQDSLRGLLPSSLVVLQLQYPMMFELGSNMEIEREHPYRIDRLRSLALHKAEDHPLLARLIWWEQYPETTVPRASYRNHFDFRILGGKLGHENVEFTFVSSPFYAGTPLAAEEVEEEEGLTRWNVPSKRHLSLADIYSSSAVVE